MTNVVQIQRKYIPLLAQPFLFVSRAVKLTELGILSECRVGPTKRGHASEKCLKKAGRFPTLQLVRVVYEASGTHHKICSNPDYV